jgi:hypothetical protein
MNLQRFEAWIRKQILKKEQAMNVIENKKKIWNTKLTIVKKKK